MFRTSKADRSLFTRLCRVTPVRGANVNVTELNLALPPPHAPAPMAAPCGASGAGCQSRAYPGRRKSLPCPIRAPSATAGRATRGRAAAAVAASSGGGGAAQRQRCTWRQKRRQVARRLVLVVRLDGLKVRARDHVAHVVAVDAQLGGGGGGRGRERLRRRTSLKSGVRTAGSARHCVGSSRRQRHRPPRIQGTSERAAWPRRLIGPPAPDRRASPPARPCFRGRCRHQQPRTRTQRPRGRRQPPPSLSHRQPRRRATRRRRKARRPPAPCAPPAPHAAVQPAVAVERVAAHPQ